MIILSIETSCDETAISIVEAKGGLNKPAFSTIAHLVSSQIEMHREFGGVVPMLAKREHGKALTPMLIQALNLNSTDLSLKHNLSSAKIKRLGEMLEREPELKEKFLTEIINIPKPKIDAITVTSGPGLEPALWVGINFAKALGTLWDLPVIPTNHLEGHIIAPLLNNTSPKPKISFPAIAAIISGGHTELALIKKWRDYEHIGRTRDDAVGEAFDKVARLLDLPYPGGPEISKLASLGKKIEGISLPRPMLHSGDFDFSFSGLKTAVLYLVKKLGQITPEQKAAIALEFENSAAEVIVAKTLKAAEKYKAKTIIVGGGVIANRAIREAFAKAVKNSKNKIELILPDNNLTGDNATMIAGAGYLKIADKTKISPLSKIVADGNLKLGK
jgi:N6-L-threonylcarbamoyladenine synthase